MKKIEENILEAARNLFNEKGVANVSIREVSRFLGISHSHLIYHFQTKNVLIERLHESIFEAALELNISIQHEPPLRGLFISTCRGFEILYAYRFFMIDMVWIMRENKSLQLRLREVETHRFIMYRLKMQEMIEAGILTDTGDFVHYEILIHQIKVISDSWLSQAVLYENDLRASIPKYAFWLLMLFYPYLTDQGKKDFEVYRREFIGS